METRTSTGNEANGIAMHLSLLILKNQLDGLNMYVF